MTTRWVVHAMFRCEVCGKEWSAYESAQKQAAAHARNTGHTVPGEVAYAVRCKGVKQK